MLVRCAGIAFDNMELFVGCVASSLVVCCVYSWSLAFLELLRGWNVMLGVAIFVLLL